MVDDSGYTKRDILEISGASLAAITGTTSLAGCSTDDGETNSTPEENDNGTMPDSTPTGTPTETDTPTPEPEELDLQYSNVNNGSDIADDVIEAQVSPSENTEKMVLGVGPSEGFEDVHRALENGDAYITQKINEVPENGQVQFTFPWMNFLYSQAEQLRENENDYVWPEAGGEQTLLASAEAASQNYTDTSETIPVTVTHPRDQLDLQAHNQRTQKMWRNLPHGENYRRRILYDTELLRQIAGPTIDQSLNDFFEWDSTPNINASSVMMKGSFEYVEDGGDISYAELLSLNENDAGSDMLGEGFEYHRSYETDNGEINIFRYKSDENPDYSSEAAYHEDNSTVVWATDSGNENVDTPPTEYGLNALEDIENTISNEEDFMNSQEYESRFLPVLGYETTPEELSKNPGGYGNLVMLDWDTDEETPYEIVVDPSDGFEIIDGPFERDDGSYLWSEF